MLQSGKAIILNEVHFSKRAYFFLWGYRHICLTTCDYSILQLILYSPSEKLNDRHPDRIRFFLSKADTAGVESDRQVGISIKDCTGELYMHAC